jgi:hypothetical protein
MLIKALHAYSVKGFDIIVLICNNWTKERKDQMEERENMTPFQMFLVDKFLDFQNQKKRPVSDNEFSRWLGVSAGSFNAWINANRTPDFGNAVKLSARLGPEVFDLLGFPRIVASRSPQLRYIVEFWEELDTEMKDLIYNHVKEEVVKRGK